MISCEAAALLSLPRASTNYTDRLSIARYDLCDPFLFLKALDHAMIVQWTCLARRSSRLRLAQHVSTVSQNP